MRTDGTAMHTGTFIDSPVAGLDYHSASAQGQTDEKGHFMYADGEMMQFSIGDVVLGEAMADDVVTLMDLIGEARQDQGVTDPMATNMGRFLQSLDADGDPENGITITPEVRDEVMGRMIDFEQSIAQFENDPFISACFDTLNALDLPHAGQAWELCPVDTAWAHMVDHMGQYMPEWMVDQMGGGSNGGNVADAPGADYPMGGMMDGDMIDLMDDHMGTGSGDAFPVNGMTTGDMIDYMDDHMGTGGTNPHPMAGDSNNPPLSNDSPSNSTAGNQMVDGMYGYGGMMSGGGHMGI